jgi:GNAT superfamily N-acetyltransferase
MHPLSITLATSDECSECARLLVEQLREHGVEVSVERLAGLLKKSITDGQSGFLLLARTGNRAVGVAYVATILSAEHCGPAGWLEELYVNPDYRNQGIGTALINAVIERARENGMIALDLEIDAAHDRAASLYERLGFRSLNRSRWVRKLKSPDR